MEHEHQCSDEGFKSAYGLHCLGCQTGIKKENRTSLIKLFVFFSECLHSISIDTHKEHFKLQVLTLRSLPAPHSSTEDSLGTGVLTGNTDGEEVT